MISVHFQGKPFNITVILVYAPNTTAKDAEVDRFFEGIKEVLEQTLKKKKERKICHFHHKELECKRGKSRDIQNNRKVWPCSENEAGLRLTEFCQENMLFIENTHLQQHKT